MNSYQKDYSDLPKHLNTGEFLAYLKEDVNFKLHTQEDREPLETWREILRRYRSKVTDCIETSMWPIMKQTTKEIEIKDISIVSGSSVQELIDNFGVFVKQLANEDVVFGATNVNYALRHEGGCEYYDDIFLDITSELLETEGELQERLWEVEDNSKIINFQKFLDKKIKQYPVYLKRKEIEKLTKEMKDLTKRIKND